MKIFYTILSVLLFSPALSASFATAATQVEKNIPTRITADGMAYDADARQVRFNKNVHVIRTDFELWANEMIVYLKEVQKKSEDSHPASALAAGDIDRIVARGNVRMKREKNTSLSERATYDMDTAILTLEGNPRLTDGENVITGEIVRYFMNENKSEVSGGKKQVEAVFSTNNTKVRGEEQ